MTPKQIKDLAHSMGFECILGDGETVCVRPMLWDEEGKRIVRHYPDPCEFTDMATALAILGN